MRESPQHGRRNKFLCNAKACASSTAPKCYVFLFSHSLPLRTLAISHSFVYNRKNAIDIFHKMPPKQTYIHTQPPHAEIHSSENRSQFEWDGKAAITTAYDSIYILEKYEWETCVCVCLWHSFPKRNINYSLSEFTHTQFESMIKKSRGNRLVHS